jgi:hypothetical protein
VNFFFNFSDGFLINKVRNIDRSATITTMSTGYDVYSTTIVATALNGLDTKLVIAYTFPLNNIGNKKLLIWYPKFITLDTCILIITIKNGINIGYGLDNNKNRMLPNTTPLNKALTTYGVSNLVANTFTYTKANASAIPSIAKLI